MRVLDKTLAEIGKTIDKQGNSFIASIDENGFPVMRAMMKIRKRDGLNTFYFSTNTSSKKIRQYLDNPQASIYFCDPKYFKGILLRGTMEVLTDAPSKKMIWEEGDETYYPLGVNDPDYCVLKFSAQNIRYYNRFKTEDIRLN